MTLHEWLAAFQNHWPQRAKNPVGRRKMPRRRFGNEHLEERRVLASTVFLDFGTGLNPQLEITTGDLRNITGVVDSGPNLVGLVTGLTSTTGLQVGAFSYDFNGDSKTDEADRKALRAEVSGVVQRVLEPFDIEVQFGSASSVADIRTLLNNNNADGLDAQGKPFGHNDAYVLVGNYRRKSDASSIALGTDLYGVAALKDLTAGRNASDEVVSVFSDEILADNTGIPGTAEFNRTLVNRFAYTVIHEAAHTLGLRHTSGDTVDQLLVSLGDQIRQGTDTRETINVVSRFPLQLDGNFTTKVNNHTKLVADADIGAANANRDAVPDMAYVTGTGAHDQITLADAGLNAAGQKVVSVRVQPFRNADRTGPIGTPFTYSIVIGKDTEGPIRIDGSVGNDLITIAETITADVTVFGGDGNDTVQGGGGHDLLYGESGDDTLSGRAGNDRLFGGVGTDTLDGGIGDDSLFGGVGNDVLQGGAQQDLLSGGSGNDRLAGGDQNDVLHGGSGQDTLQGDNGDDKLEGGNDNDLLQGGPGVDRLNGGQGVDSLDGGAGADVIVDFKSEDSRVADPLDTFASAPAAPATPATTPVAAVAGTISSVQARAITQALQQFVTRVRSAGSVLPIGKETAGAILADALDRGLVSPVVAFFRNNTAPTVNGLLNVLRLLPTNVSGNGLTVTVANVSATTGTTLRFNLQWHVIRDAQVAIDRFSGAQALFGATGLTLPMTSTILLPLSFGIGSAGAFVGLPTAGMRIVHSIDSSGLSFSGNLGLLNTSTTDAQVQLQAATQVVIPGSSDGILTSPELTATDPVTVTPSGSFFAELPFETQLGARSEAGVVSISQADLSAASPVNAFDVQGADEVKAMANLNSFAVFQYLKDVENILKNVSNGAELAASLPLASNLKLQEIADFATAFRVRVIDKLIDSAGQPNFQTAQDLIDRLATGIAQGTAPVLGLSYDAGRKELVFQMNLLETIFHDMALNVGGTLSRLADVQLSNPVVRLQSNIRGSLAFGMRLNAQPGVDSAHDRFFLRNLSFGANITGSLTNIRGSARLGIFDLKLVNGTSNINLNVGVSGSTSGSLRDLKLTPNLGGSAKLALGLQFDLAGPGISLPVLPANTQLVVETTNLANPQSLTARITPELQVTSLVDSLESVAMGHIVDGLQKVVTFLRGAQAKGVFQQKIPVLNRSLADLLDSGEKLESLRRELTETPPATLKQLVSRMQTALGAAIPVRFQAGVLELDLSYGFTQSAKLDLGFDLDDQLNAGVLEEFIDVNGSTPVDLKLEGTAKLGLVVDVNSATPVVSLKDTSLLSVKALVNASNIEFAAAIGPLGVFIRNGQIRLDNGTVNQPAVFALGLVPSTTRRHEISGLLSAASSLVQTTATGALDVDLPVHFPTSTERQGKLHLSVASLQDIAGTTDLDEAALPDLASAIGSIDLNSLIDMVVSGLDRMLSQIESRFDLPQLPLIGNDLTQATSFLRGIRERVVSKLEELDSLSNEAVKGKIVEALGTSGLGFLVDRNLDGKVDRQDVTVDFSLAQRRVDVAFQLAGQNVPINKEIHATAGLDGLGLQLEDAALQLKVGFRFDVGFGVSADDGFYLHTGAVGSLPELSIDLEASLSNPNAATAADMARLRGELGFFDFAVTDSFQVVQPDGGRGSFLHGRLQLDLVDPGQGTKADGHLTLGEFRSAKVTDVLKPRINLDANVQLHLAADVSSFPAFQSDFELVYHFDTAGLPSDNGIRKLGFNDVRINVGEFFNRSIAPVLENVERTLLPLVPVANALTTPLPVISDLAGKSFTLIDLARQFGKIEESSLAFIEAVKSVSSLRSRVSTMLSQLPGQDSGFLPLGDFTLDPLAASQASNAGKLTPLTSVGTNANVKDDSGFSITALKNPTSLFKLLLGQDVSLVTYELPKLDLNFNYSQFFPVLGPVGVTLGGRVGALADLSFGYDTTGFRQFRAGGYDDPQLLLNGFYISDTASPDGSGQDVPELQLFGGLEAFVTVDLVLAEFGGGGGLKAKVNFDLNDPNRDGKMHFHEIVAAFDTDSSSSSADSHLNALRRLINVSGELSGELSVFAKTPLKTFERTLAKVTLVDFNSEVSVSEPEPILAERDSAGVLRINMGPRAGQRLYRGHTIDADERFTISSIDNSNVSVTFHAIEAGQPRNYTQTFTNVTQIFADAGDGNDTITLTSTQIPAEVRGGEGADQLSVDGKVLALGGLGNDNLRSLLIGATLDGESGDDTMQGGEGADTIRGGAGRDTLRGGGGDDVLEGGTDQDQLFGEGGNDTLRGAEDNDQLDGGLGDDRLSGDAGQDVLRGGEGDDLLSGGDDNDSLLGDAGDDHLLGEDGDDSLRGGLGQDLLDGARGNDQLVGDAGNDRLIGGLGADSLFGSADNDELHGGVGADRLFGGLGADRLFGESGVDALFGDEDQDFLFGGLDDDELSGGAGDDELHGDEGNDHLAGFGFIVLNGQMVGNDELFDGNDQLQGGAGDDTLFGGRGADALEGGTGRDVIQGQSGEDKIQFAVGLVDSRVDAIQGGPDRDLVEILGTNEAEELTARQLSATTFEIQRKSLENGTLLATFQFSLPANPADRDIELLRVSGQGGNDTLRALGTFNVNQLQLSGGEGDDLLVGSLGADLLFGGGGNDTLRGESGRDELYGGDGDDLLQGGTGSDVLYGEAGADTLRGEADSDGLFGGTGDDLLEAGTGLFGDVMHGEDGNDRLLGGDGLDVMFGGTGNDTLEGRGQSDIIHGDEGNDTLLGGIGRDFLNGGQGDDQIFGLSADTTAESTLPGDWQLVDDELFARESVLRDERKVVDAALIAINLRLQEIQAAQEVPSEELLLEQNRLLQRQADLANSRAIINLQQINIDPVQTVQVDILLGGDGNDTLRGSNFNDKIFGDAGDDTLEHTPGDDLIFGGSHVVGDRYRVSASDANNVITIELQPGLALSAPRVIISVDNVVTRVDHLEIETASVEALGGDDLITVKFGNNAIMQVDVDGGSGNDTIDASTLQDKGRLRGGSGADLLLGGLSDDVLEGGDGDDVIRGAQGSDSLHGDAGNDSLTGGLGQDQFDGGTGVDRILENVSGQLNFETPLKMTLLSPGATIPVADTLVSGTMEELVLTGSEAADSINTRNFAGRAIISAGDGNDTVVGGSLADRIDGGSGDDQVTGGGGDDQLDGGLGTDQLVEAGNTNFTLSNTSLTGLGIDTLAGFERAKLTGGIGANTLRASAFSGPVELDGGDGNDTLIGTAVDDLLIGGNGDDNLSGGFGNDRLQGVAGNDTLQGNDGNDQLDGGAGNDRIFGGNGDDLAIGGLGSDSVRGDAGIDTLYGDLETTGSNLGDGADTLDGGIGNDHLFGGGGIDTLLGNTGNDVLRGGTENDILKGGAGDDSLIGELGNDQLFGDDLDDGTAGSATNGHDQLDGGAGDDQLFGFGGLDRLDGGSGADTLDGGSGGDSLQGGLGNDQLRGGQGDDTLRGNVGNDLLFGGTGNDRLFGDGGQDQLLGEDGKDFLDGSQDDQQDRLTGGTGQDTFVQYFVERRVFDPITKTFMDVEVAEELFVDRTTEDLG